MRKDSELFLKKILDYRNSTGKNNFELSYQYFDDIPSVETVVYDIINDLIRNNCLTSKSQVIDLEGDISINLTLDGITYFDDEKERNSAVIFNVSGGQVNIASGNAKIDAVQNTEKKNILLVDEEENDEEYIDERVKDIKKYFVKTSPYNDALRTLDSSNIVLLVGVSGSGKSDNSIMLAKEYGEGYALKYAEGSDFEKAEIENLIKEIKKRNNYGKKEIIILDDFLGKTHLNVDEEYINLINELIKYVKQNNYKKLILNSRGTILEDAKIKNKNLKAYMENDIDIIDISKLENIEEKCKILTNYVMIYNMQDGMKNIIKNKNVLVKILEHENFSPLIINRVLYSCSKSNDKDLEKAFFTILDNPDNVWENEISALNKYSKMYLNILYSMSDTWIKQKYVDEAFLKYIEKKEIEYDENIQKTVQRLKNILNFEDDRITFLHPSIMDYLKKELSVHEKKEIILYAMYFEQIERLDETKEHILQLYNSEKDIKKFFSLKVLPYTYSNFSIELFNYIGVKFLDYMLKLKIKANEELVVAIVQEIFKCGRLLLLHSSSIVLNVLLLDYDFSEIFNNDSYMEALFDTLYYEEIGKLIEVLCIKSEGTFDFRMLKPFIKQAVITKLNEAAEEKVNETIQSELSVYVEEYFKGLDEGEEFYYEDVANEIIEDICEDIDIKSIAEETKINLCEKYKLRNYEDAIGEYDIEIDCTYVEEFIIDYNEH